MTRELRITRPTVTIEPDRPKVSGGSDWVHYTLTRTGSVGHEATVTVNLAGPAGNDWGLDDPTRLSREATFAAGSATTVLSVWTSGHAGPFSIGYDQDADFDGPLTASLAAHPGYVTDDTAAVDVVAVPAPRWFGRVVEQPFRIEENDLSWISRSRSTPPPPTCRRRRTTRTGSPRSWCPSRPRRARRPTGDAGRTWEWTTSQLLHVFGVPVRRVPRRRRRGAARPVDGSVSCGT